MDLDPTGRETAHSPGLFHKIGKKLHDIFNPDVETRRERERLAFAKALERGRYILIRSGEGGPVSREHLDRLHPASSHDKDEDVS